MLSGFWRLSSCSLLGGLEERNARVFREVKSEQSEVLEEILIQIWIWS